MSAPPANIALMKAFTTDGGEAAVQDAISRLNFIARLKPGERVDASVPSAPSVHANTLYQRAWRAVFSDASRRTTRDYIKETVNDAFTLACDYLAQNTDFGRLIGERLLEALAAARTGILSLADTYADDGMLVSQLSALIAMLDIKIAGVSGAARPPGAAGAVPVSYAPSSAPYTQSPAPYVYSG